MENGKTVECGSCKRKVKWYTTFGSGYVFICECGDFIFVDENFQYPRNIRKSL